MKTTIKVIIIYILYRVVIEKPTPWWNHTYRSAFKFHPRKIPTLIVYTILSPFIMLWSGIVSLPIVWSSAWKVESWTSYEIISEINQKPKKINCYKLF